MAQTLRSLACGIYRYVFSILARPARCAGAFKWGVDRRPVVDGPDCELANGGIKTLLDAMC